MGKKKLNAAAGATTQTVAVAKKSLVAEEDNEQSLADTAQSQQMQQSSAPFEKDTSTAAYLWLLVFSTLMFTFPFITFYGVRRWLDESFDMTPFQTNCFSVLAAVLVVNAIICLYVYKAFSEGSTPPAPKPAVQEQKKTK